jgi:hypothetical protein
MWFIHSVLAGRKKIGYDDAQMSRCCHCLLEVPADKFNMNDGPYYMQKVIKTIKIVERWCVLTGELAYMLFSLEGTLPKEATQVGLSKGMTSLPARVM